MKLAFFLTCLLAALAAASSVKLNEDGLYDRRHFLRKAMTEPLSATRTGSMTPLVQAGAKDESMPKLIRKEQQELREVDSDTRIGSYNEDLFFGQIAQCNVHQVDLDEDFVDQTWNFQPGRRYTGTIENTGAFVDCPVTVPEDSIVVAYLTWKPRNNRPLQDLDLYLYEDIDEYMNENDSPSLMAVGGNNERETVIYFNNDDDVVQYLRVVGCNTDGPVDYELVVYVLCPDVDGVANWTRGYEYTNLDGDSVQVNDDNMFYLYESDEVRLNSVGSYTNADPTELPFYVGAVDFDGNNLYVIASHPVNLDTPATVDMDGSTLPGTYGSPFSIELQINSAPSDVYTDLLDATNGEYGVVVQDDLDDILFDSADQSRFTWAPVAIEDGEGNVTGYTAGQNRPSFVIDGAQDYYRPGKGYVFPGFVTYEQTSNGLSITNWCPIEATFEVNPEQGLLETKLVENVTDEWQRVQLCQDYDVEDVVIVTTVHYANNDVPVVTRIDNIESDSFDLRLQNPNGTVPLQPERVSVLVVETGEYLLDGIRFRAGRTVATKTNRGSALNAPQVDTLPPNYLADPVVIGQVMSYNDEEWSAFFYKLGQQGELSVGKFVGDEFENEREDEVVGWVAIEGGHPGTFISTDFATGDETEVYHTAHLSDPVIEGMSQNPPFEQAVGGCWKVGFTGLEITENERAAWTQFFGTEPSDSKGNVLLAIDEDDVVDSERRHRPARVGFWLFEEEMCVNRGEKLRDRCFLRLDGTTETYAQTMLPFEFPAGRDFEGLTVGMRIRTSDLNKRGAAFSYSETDPERNHNQFTFWNYKQMDVIVDDHRVHIPGINFNGNPMNAFNDGEWHYLAATWTAKTGELVFYRDCELVYKDVVRAGNVLTPMGTITIGQDQDVIGGGFVPDQSFEGDIDSIFVSDPLTPNEYYDLINVSANTVEGIDQSVVDGIVESNHSVELYGSWNFNDCSSFEFTRDCSNYGNDLHLHGNYEIARNILSEDCT